MGGFWGVANIQGNRNHFAGWISVGLLGWFSNKTLAAVTWG